MTSTTTTASQAVTDDFSALLTQNTQVSKLLANINTYKYNPSGIQRLALGALSDVTNGTLEVVDPTNPFVYLLEASAVNTAAAIIDNNATTRQLYPSLAQTVDDLYRHMADTDYVDRFAIPAKTTFSVWIKEEDLLSAMVYDQLTGISRATIPRNSTFTVADTVFSLQYPINIEVLSHGGLQVVYDNTVASPLQDLTTNLVFWEYRTPAGTSDRYVYIEFEVFQFQITTSNGGLNTADGFNQQIFYPDSYYYTRVYYQPTVNSHWIEIATTHTDMVYDPIKPTAVLKVVEGQVGVAPSVTVTIPQIYLTSGLLTGTMRVDVYSTKGDITMLMSNYSLGAFTAEWKNIDETEDTPYTNVMSTLTNLMVYSTAVVSGGSASLSFEALRARVIMNSVGAQQLPITPAQIQASLQNNGYTIVQNVDLVTNRIYLATKPVPPPSTDALLTSAATSVETLQITIGQALAHSGVYDNTPYNRITISPKLIYTNVNGVITPLSSASQAALMALQPAARARAVNAANYLYTPFHYVLDTNDDAFVMRPYYLANPQAKALLFETQNDTTSLQVNTAQYSIEVVDSGYRVDVVTTGNTAYNALADESVFAMLSFVPEGEVNRAYQLGTQTGVDDAGNRIFSFDLNTNYDIDASDLLQLTSFKMNDTSNRIFSASLTDKFDIFYVTDAVMPNGFVASGVDSLVPDYLLPAGTVVVTQELLTLQFGSSLTTLWSRARSVVQASAYQTYPANVPMVYEKDVYEMDSSGSIFTVNGDGTLTYHALHRVGDPVLDSGGNPVYKHLAGDNVLDSQGLPIPITNEAITRQIDLLFIEGPYFFVTDPAAATYASTIVQTMVNWLTQEIAAIDQSLLEQTSVYYYPKTNMGTVTVFADGQSDPFIIDAGQALVLNLYVTQQVSDNTVLVNALSASSVKTIDAAMDAVTVSMKDIENQLRQLYGNDVISFTLTGLGGSANYATLSMVNPSERVAIKKNLLAQPDGTLTASEAVEVNFIVHTTSATT